MHSAAPGVKCNHAPPNAAAPTANQVTACNNARAQHRDVFTTWTAMKTTGLAALNAKRKAGGQPLVPVGE